MEGAEASLVRDEELRRGWEDIEAVDAKWEALLSETFKAV